MGKNPNKMTLEQIIQNKELFLKNYGIENEFEESCCDWDELMEIARQFDEKRQTEYPKIIKKYISEISEFESIHSYRYRIKETDSLIKKVILKTKEKRLPIRKKDYLTEITDLLGIRVLYVFKEDYFEVHRQIHDAYKEQMVEPLQIKLQPGDDIKIYEKILKYKHSIDNKGPYRSIHYTLCATPNNMKGPRLEIQTRTIFEEAWSEINHKLVYKNREMSEYFALVQASKILSDLVGNCDTLGMLMKTIHDEYTKQLSENDLEKGTAQSNIIMGEVLQRFLMK